MTSLTVTSALPRPLCSWAWTPRPQRRRGLNRCQPTVPEQQPISQIQAQAQARSESAALWEVMMRPA